MQACHFCFMCVIVFMNRTLDVYQDILIFLIFTSYMQIPFLLKLAKAFQMTSYIHSSTTPISFSQPVINNISKSKLYPPKPTKTKIGEQPAITKTIMS